MIQRMILEWLCRLILEWSGHWQMFFIAWLIFFIALIVCYLREE